MAASAVLPTCNHSQALENRGWSTAAAW